MLTRSRYKALTVETVSTHALLYTWQGWDETLKPMLLMAHSDVSTYDFAPHSGTIGNGFRLFLLVNQPQVNGLILPFQVTTMESSFGVEDQKTTSPTSSQCSLPSIVYSLATSNLSVR